MTAVNPYVDHPDKAVAFELGYVWGFSNPGAEDNPPPYSPEFLDIYEEGVDAGRDDWIRPPDGPVATTWVHWSELEGQEEHEWVEHLLIEGFAEGFAHLFHKAAIGLAGLVVTVLGIPGNTKLRPLPEDFEQPYVGPDSEDTYYAATCPRDDHPIPDIGTTPEGYWIGSAYNDFGAALREAVAHPHAEARVARCSLTEQTCGLVWAAR